MYRWLCLIVLLIAGCFQVPTEVQAGIPRWDALPAVDVMHLQGPYAGRNVCPICQHGYDAGMLVFLPATTSPADAARIAGSLSAVTAEVDDERFRPFLILTGNSPSPALLAAVKSNDTNWYVAHLSRQALPEATRDFKIALNGRARGYVFAQRRLLLAFDPANTAPSHAPGLMRYANYAMTFLRSTYNQPVASNHPDTHKGRLWLAPNTLSTSITFTKGLQPVSAHACFFEDEGDGRTWSAALVALTVSNSPQRTLWARTDDDGCVSLEGANSVNQVHIEVFSALREVATARIDARDLQAGERLDIHLAPTDLTPTDAELTVAGNEPVAGPCEGCEAVFQGLPANLTASTRLAPTSEPGEPLVLTGIVKDAADVPQPNMVVYAYHTDQSGHYPTDPRLSSTAARHGRLRGWGKTDAAGRYTFHTIRPGSYPESSVPQHIHMHVIEPGRCTYFLGDVLFTDDPRLTNAIRAEEEQHPRGGSGIVQPEGNKQDGWKVVRNVTLGLNVPGYRECSNRS